MNVRLAAVAVVPCIVLLACSTFSETDQPQPDDASTDAETSFEDSSDLETSSRIDAAPDREDAAMSCPGAADCERVVFVASGVKGGKELNGIAGGDTLCNMAAGTATSPRVQGRSFRAWLSGPGQPAAGRLVHGTKPYVLPNGTLIANDWAGFAQDIHLAPISIDENGMPSQSLEQRVWTGTNDDGSAGQYSCGTWSVLTDQGQLGNLTAPMSWSSGGNTQCADKLHVYCVEQ